MTPPPWYGSLNVAIPTWPEDERLLVANRDPLRSIRSVLKAVERDFGIGRHRLAVQIRIDHFEELARHPSVVSLVESVTQNTHVNPAHIRDLLDVEDLIVADEDSTIKPIDILARPNHFEPPAGA